MDGSLALLALALTAPSAPVDYARDVKPILEAACVSCHGADKRKGELRLDTRKGAMEGGLSGPSIIPGKSADSPLLRRILGLDDEDRMPLKAEPLTEAQVAVIRRWIDEGASWPEEGPVAEKEEGHAHWAYRKPVRPAVPAVKGARWVRNPIDAFVLARLEKEGLAPSPEAEEETLLRRVYLDLVGLPPSPAEVDAFRRGGGLRAYEKVVDRLLASPHYGEKWARSWLDLARYADSHGYEKDGLRVAWKWRDWVIEALNANMSFKQFTIEQIAGDMLPNATVSQKIATGFNRNTLLNQEGGVDDEEARWEVLVDRVATTTTAWLGSTLACAQCHNHKYDPFSQKDFYRFLAFFDNHEYRIQGRHPESYVVEPELSLPTPEQAQARARLEAEIAEEQKKLDPARPENVAARRAWEEAVRAAERQWTVLRVVRAVSRGGATLKVLPDGSILASGTNPEADAYEIELEAPAEELTGLRLEVLGHPSLPAGGPGRSRDGNFFLTEVELQADGEAVELARAAADEYVSDHKIETLIKGGASAGWAIDPETKAARRQAVFVADKAFGQTGGRLVVRLVHDMPRTTRSLGRFRLSATTAADPTLVAMVPTALRAALDLPPDKRTQKQEAELGQLYVRVAPALRPVHDRITTLRRSIDDLKIPTAMVMAERPGFERPSTHLRVRGTFTNVGEKVWAGTPKVLPALPEDAPVNRLGLALWLVSDDNPLTARVTVNRIWAEYFGRGIVETLDDFGTQSPPPTHPELLDFLATELARTGWDLKALHRLIVTSATYRQSSRVTRALLEKDPQNKLYARGPRFRLEAETIRDVALAAAGLLSRKIGGPSVFPPQPEGIWDQPYSGVKWTVSEGEDRYRRGLYTFLRRTSPYPSMLAFDGVSREVCVAQRTRTNTPLQALVTLNDPVFFEAAEALGRRAVKEGGATVESRARHAFRLATARTPGQAELDAVVRYFHLERAKSGSEARAWTLVANVLLNLDETVTKE